MTCAKRAHSTRAQPVSNDALSLFFDAHAVAIPPTQKEFLSSTYCRVDWQGLARAVTNACGWWVSVRVFWGAQCIHVVLLCCVLLVRARRCGANDHSQNRRISEPPCKSELRSGQNCFLRRFKLVAVGAITPLRKEFLKKR